MGVARFKTPVVCSIDNRYHWQYYSSMNTATKLLEAMHRNPLDWRLEQLQTVARQYGIDWRHEGSSHCIFILANGTTLPVPARRPIKPIYIKKFVALVKGV